MKLFPRFAILAFFSIAFFQSGAQTLPGTLPIPTKFQSIEVNESSLLKGQLLLDTSLTISGKAKYLNSILTGGDLEVRRQVFFTGLNTAEEFTGGLLSLDPTGQLQNLPIGVLINELKKHLEFGVFDSLQVTQNAFFYGDLLLGDSTTIDGNALFAKTVEVAGDFRAERLVRFNSLPEVSTAVNQILSIDTTGTLARVSASQLGAYLRTDEDFSYFDTLTVGQSATFAGNMNVAGALIGTAVFSQALSTGDFNAAGSIVFPGLPQAGFTVENAVLGINANGQVIRLDLTEQGISDAGCALGADGIMESKPNRWKFKDNVIHTNECTRDPRVGIGKVNPAFALDVAGRANFDNGVYAARNSNPVGAAHVFGGKMLIGGDPGPGGSNLNKFIELGFDGANTYINSEGGTSLLINYYSHRPVAIGNSESDTPAKLVANGGIRVGDKQTGTPELIGKGELIITGKDKFISDGHVASAYFGNLDNSIKAIKATGLSISTEEGPNALFLQKGGKLGLGTGLVNPSAIFHIKTASTDIALIYAENGTGAKFKVTKDGIIYGRGYNMTMDNFPDYVFTEDYQLPSLFEIKLHIDKYGRLPKMPSAEQVATEGVELGNVTRLMVEKIEELTLLLIQQEERMKQMEEQLKTLKNKN